MKYPAPVVLFVYNRPWHLQQTVEALKRNELARESALFVFSDGPKGNMDQEGEEKVQEYVKTITGFKNITVTEREKNLGLANSIISGVTEIINRYGHIIVLEDDMVTSPYFLKYMNDALELYKDEERVASIHAYIYPVKNNLPETYFIRGADCWGWATWARAWKFFEPDGEKLLHELKRRNLSREFDFNNSYGYSQMLEDQEKGKNDSWAIRWYASAFLRDMLTLYPGTSLVANIGHDSSGTHCGESEIFDADLADRPLILDKLPIEENMHAKKEIEKFFRSMRFKQIHQKIKARLKRIIS